MISTWITEENMGLRLIKFQSKLDETRVARHRAWKVDLATATRWFAVDFLRLAFWAWCNRTSERGGGWRFWRCFASTVVLHKEDVVRELIETLAAHGVQPSSVDAPVTSIHVESRKVMAFPKDDVSQDGAVESNENLSKATA